MRVSEGTLRRIDASKAASPFAIPSMVTCSPSSRNAPLASRAKPRFSITSAGATTSRASWCGALTNTARCAPPSVITWAIRPAKRIVSVSIASSYGYCEFEQQVSIPGCVATRRFGAHDREPAGSWTWVASAITFAYM
jgi:hypothetical protein